MPMKPTTNKNLARNLKRIFALAVAFGVAWLIYMVAVIMMPTNDFSGFDGMVGFMFQVIFGAIIAAVITGISALLGFAIRKYIPVKFQPNRLVHSLIVLLSLFFLLFGTSIGLAQKYTDQETGIIVNHLNGVVAVVCYVLIVFCIANWPMMRKIVSDPSALK